MAAKGKFKDTLNLPRTEFPMRGGLAKREPEFLKGWEEAGLYNQILDRRKDAPPYVLHDGPPYSNGHIHYGHILNKILKDLVVKYRSMAGFRCPYIPGWDTHGLPIELAVDRELGDKKNAMSTVEFRHACRDYALRFVDLQRDEFKRLGVFGRWDDPYLTLNPRYEGAVVRALAAFARGGFLYRGKKPVYWCPNCKTALAEAEIEYADHTSPSIYVRFPLVDGAPDGLGAVAGKPAALIIWTTTPWTIPSNLAVVLSDRFDYVAIPSPAGRGPDGEHWIVAKDLAETFLGAVSAEVPESDWIDIDKESLRSLEGARYRHPFNSPAHPEEDPEGPSRRGKGDNDFKVWFADHVTLEQGTGLVHTAPGHGTDDYRVGVEHGLATYAPIDDEGRFTDEVPDWQGQTTFEANPKITQRLADDGYLLNKAGETVRHSYPHCWRCKGPVLFRATDQWFLSIDHAELRQRALHEIDNTTWVPEWGRNRIRGMIENRPDWVLSRQRTWGVPIPTFYCDDCGVTHAEAETMEHVAKLFDEQGADAWYALDVAELLPTGVACDCGGTSFTREQAIVDVWFESGSSWLAMAGEPDHDSIDLYLEGSDQHRGWFHSSLLVGIGVSGSAPYKTVITHGFVLDENGHPYSKSSIEKARAQGKKTKYVPPDKVISQNGAEFLRLWVASTEFKHDMPYSQALMDGLKDWYRKFRNTCRFMLGNLSDFSPDDYPLDKVALSELDHFALARLGDLVATIRESYDDFEFHAVYRALVEYIATDLSSFYLDVLKDRLYNDKPDSERRRAAQAVLYIITATLAKLSAPILCFTGEDVWRHLPAKQGRPESVHLSDMPTGKHLGEDELHEKWATLLSYRDAVSAALEAFRAEKHRSEDAAITIVPLAADRDALKSSLADLPDLFIVSSVTLADDDAAGDAPTVTVAKAPGEKCERCWRYYDTLVPGEDDLCARCADAVAAARA